MTVSISISPHAEAKLREKAAAHGQSLEVFASRVLEQVATAPSVDEALAPFGKQVADSGMTDQQLDDFFEELREKAFQERQRRSA